jgi:ribosomal protein S18 acetylase RimI-like enzyme
MTINDWAETEWAPKVSLSKIRMMKISSRSYQDETDKHLMIALARQYPTEHLRVLDLPYRLSSWALDDPQNARLWFDADGELVGWAVLQTPWWTIDITCRPDAISALYGEILAWADERARQAVGTPGGLPTWYVNVFSDQTDHLCELETVGFANQADVGEDSWSKMFMRRPGELPVKEYRIPAGFMVRSLAGEAEVEAYVEMHRAVFGTKNMTVEWRRRTLQHPDYRPDLDIVVATPEGNLAAFCVCWLHGNRGQVEPLGCHADYRRYALGRIALAEGLRRLQAAGVEQIFVETDHYRNTALNLYEHMGFQVFREVWVYHKDYELGAFHSG